MANDMISWSPWYWPWFGAMEACRLALEKLILPELGHIAHLLNL